MQTENERMQAVAQFGALLSKMADTKASLEAIKNNNSVYTLATDIDGKAVKPQELKINTVPLGTVLLDSEESASALANYLNAHPELIHDVFGIPEDAKPAKTWHSVVDAYLDEVATNKKVQTFLIEDVIFELNTAGKAGILSGRICTEDEVATYVTEKVSAPTETRFKIGYTAASKYKIKVDVL